MLLYVATVLLNRTEREFWRMSPRKLNALTEAHIKMNPREGSKDSGGAKQGFIDQITF